MLKLLERHNNKCDVTACKLYLEKKAKKKKNLVIRKKKAKLNKEFKYLMFPGKSHFNISKQTYISL